MARSGNLLGSTLSCQSVITDGEMIGRDCTRPRLDIRSPTRERSPLAGMTERMKTGDTSDYAAPCSLLPPLQAL